MSGKNEMRDRLGPMFEAIYRDRGLPFALTHGACSCGKASCAYEDPRTGIMFTGFVLAWDYLAERQATVVMMKEFGQ